MVPGNCPADEKAYLMDEARVSQQLSPADRPSSLPVAGSAPLPVPTQRQAYEQMQRQSVSPSSSPAKFNRRFSNNRASSSPRSRKSSESSNNVDIGSLTPPNTTFALGTPPTNAGFLHRGKLIYRNAVLSMA